MRYMENMENNGILKKVLNLQAMVIREPRRGDINIIWLTEVDEGNNHK